MKNPHAYIQDSKQIEALESITRVDENGYLYQMDVEYDYYSLPQDMLKVFDAGCSSFITKNLDGEALFCRNYDYTHFKNNNRENSRTGINMIVKGNNPKARYKSIGTADMFWADYRNGTIVEGIADDGKTDLSAFVLAPFICMDGINTAGFGCSILALPTLPIYTEIDFDSWKKMAEESKIEPKMLQKGEGPNQLDWRSKEGLILVNEEEKIAWRLTREFGVRQNEPGKPSTYHTILMRMMLDNCATVDQAIGLAKSYNITTAVKGSDFHIFLVDASGKSALLEWVEGQLQILETNAVTNYYKTRADRFGAGYEREDVLVAGLKRYPYGMKQQTALCMLEVVSQDPQCMIAGEIKEGKTQWSSIYNLAQHTMRIYSFGDFEKYWDYSL